VEQGVINKEAEKRLLAAFINGLIGDVGRQIRMHMPDNIEKALNITIVTITAEREEKAIGRDERGLSTRVFAVGGSRESIPVNRGEYRPRGRNQWSNCRGSRSQNRSGRLQYSTGVDGTNYDRTDNGLL